MSIPGFSEWLKTAQGRYITGWEVTKVGVLVSDVFGFNAIQIGLPELDFLAENRMPLRKKVGDPGTVDVRCDISYLPFATASVDLVVLAHSLEFHPEPHQLLREVERILIPEGQVVVVGFNPYSLWGLRHRLPRCPEGFPWNGRYIGVPRLKDWLSLLSFEIERGHFGRYAPPLRTERAFRRWRWMEKAGDRWWPIAGGVYVIRAVKRVHGMRLLKPSWQRMAEGRKALSPVAQKPLAHKQNNL